MTPRISKEREGTEIGKPGRGESGERPEALELKGKLGRKDGSLTLEQTGALSRAAQEGTRGKGRQDSSGLPATFAWQPPCLCWTVFVPRPTHLGSQMHTGYNLLSLFVQLTIKKKSIHEVVGFFVVVETEKPKRTAKWVARWIFTNWTEYMCTQHPDPGINDDTHPGRPLVPPLDHRSLRRYTPPLPLTGQTGWCLFLQLMSINRLTWCFVLFLCFVSEASSFRSTLRYSPIL